MKKRNTSYNQGAGDERSAICRKIARMLSNLANRTCPNEIVLTDLRDWIALRSQRTGYAPGGLGKRLIRPTTKTRPAVKAQKSRSGQGEQNG